MEFNLPTMKKLAFRWRGGRDESPSESGGWRATNLRATHHPPSCTETLVNDREVSFVKDGRRSSARRYRLEVGRICSCGCGPCSMLNQASLVQFSCMQVICVPR